MAISTDLGVPFIPGQDFYDHILKVFYRDGIAETVIYPNTLLKDVVNNADSTRVSGKQIYFPVHIEDTMAYSAIGELGTLPGADGQKYDNYTFFIRHMYSRVKVTGIMEDVAQGIGSYLRAWDTEVSGAARALQRQRQRVYWNDGSGRLCETTGATNSATHTVRLHSGILNVATCPMAPTFHVKPGMRLALVSNPLTAPALVGVRTVVSVSSSTEFVLNAPIAATAAGDAFVIASTLSATDLRDTCFMREPMGIGGIITDGNPLHDATFQGVDATLAANSWSRANIMHNSGVARAFSSTLMDEAMERALEIADAYPTKCYTSFKLRTAIANWLKLDRRFNSDGGATRLDGGHNAISWNGVEIKVDRDCPGGRIWLPHTPDLRLYTVAGPTWMSGDGSVRNRVTDQDAYEATIYLRETMGCDVRDKHTLVLDILEV